MTSRLDARPVTSNYGYNDPLSRLRSVGYQNGSDDDFSKDYDHGNNVTHVASRNGGTYDYLYDELNRVIRQTWTYGGQSYVTTYHYDPAGCLDSMAYPSGATLTLTCDTANRVRSVSLGSSVIVSNISYHPSGQVKEMTYGNGRTTAIDYDSRARVYWMNTPEVIGLYYGYDGADNVVSLENVVGPYSQRMMGYDVLDRLVSTIAGNQWGSAGYGYDALGNRTMESVGSFTTHYTYDAQTNRLAYADGKPLRHQSMTFTWDVANRLASSSDGATYRYDAHGRRVQKADPNQTTVYHYDAAGRVLAETLADGTKLREYLYLGNKLIAVDGCMEAIASSSCAERQWYHTDTLGSVLARTDGDGMVVARFDYQPWGEPWSMAGVEGDRQYNGRVYDSGTGFHDYGARMYWPEIGRFVSVDTERGNPGAPQTMNLYAYTLGNPYKYTDPNGNSVLDPRAGYNNSARLAAQMAAVSVDESRSWIVRAAAVFVGTIASLSDSETSWKAELVTTTTVS